MTSRAQCCWAINVALLAASLVVGVTPAPLNAAATAKRIVSPNLCTDELVLRLADHANIASITWLSKDPISANAVDLAAGLPVNHGLAEEVIPLDPDLVVAGTFTARAAVAMLKQTRFPVTEFGVAQRGRCPHGNPEDGGAGRRTRARRGVGGFVRPAPR
jgi:iron complex transport system substrate-binding protein